MINILKSLFSFSGEYLGGGVCLNCQDFTTGNNCEQCRRGYYRPQGANPQDSFPCLPCLCKGVGTTGECIRDDSQANLGRLPGTCICKQGFGVKRDLLFQWRSVGIFFTQA